DIKKVVEQSSIPQIDTRGFDKPLANIPVVRGEPANQKHSLEQVQTVLHGMVVYAEGIAQGREI
ncbi:MAG: hypothetical protein RLZZ408_680, partial [Verrucomicrobiota bacterium]